MRQEMRLALVLAMVFASLACQKTANSLKEVTAVAVGRGKVVIKTESGDLKRGPNDFVVEFQDSTGRLLSVEDASLSAVMPMPGMSPMTTSLPLQPGTEKGRFTGKAEFGMSGSWQFTADFKLPAGPERASFNLNVR